MEVKSISPDSVEMLSAPLGPDALTWADTCLFCRRLGEATHMAREGLMRRWANGARLK